MILITIFRWGYKPTYNWGGPSCGVLFTFFHCAGHELPGTRRAASCSPARGVAACAQGAVAAEGG